MLVTDQKETTMNTLAPIDGAPPSQLTHTIPTHVNNSPVLAFVADDEYVLTDATTPAGYVLCDLGHEFVTWHVFRNSAGGWDADTGHYHWYGNTADAHDPEIRRNAYRAARKDLAARA